MFKKFSSLILFIILFFNSYLVRAHHPLAGKEMTTFLDGLLSGLGHPILGIDHFFFILGVGIVSFLCKKIFTTPIIFVVGMLIGIYLILYDYTLYYVELVITLSIITIGYIIAIKRKVNYRLLSFSIILAGLFHGWAFGETIIGQESRIPIVLFGYLIGLSVIVLILSIFIGYLFKDLNIIKKYEEKIINISGGIVLGVGIFLILEAIEAAIFIVS